MELNVKIVEVLPVQKGTSSRGEWEKHQFVVSWMDGQYEQKRRESKNWGKNTEKFNK